MRAVIVALRYSLGMSLCLLPWNAYAQGNSDVHCVLDEASVMAFGQYDPMSTTPLDVQGRVSYRCDNGQRGNGYGQGQNQGHGQGQGQPKDPLTLQIALSTGQAGTFQRYMSGGRDRLKYNLYLDPVRTIVWGDGTGGTQVYTAHAQPNGHVVVVPVFGRVVPEQDVADSSYVDTIIVTLDF